MIQIACDANVPVAVFIGYGMLRQGDPLALLIGHPWLLLSSLAFPAAFALAQLYSPRLSVWSWQAVSRTVATALAVVAVFSLAFFVLGDRVAARELFAALGGVMLAEIFATRALVSLRRRRARAVRSALVVGAGPDGLAVIDCTLREPRLRVRVVGFIDDDPLKRNFQYKGVPVLGNGQNVPEIAARCGVNLIVSAVLRPQNAGLIKNLLRLKMNGTEVVEMPTFFERATGQCPIRHVEDSWFLYQGSFDHLRRPVLQASKRSIDVLLSAAGLVVSLPLVAFVALLIRLESRGPVFSRLECIGRGEVPFHLLKFRTLRADYVAAEAPDLTSVRDYRVTRAGRWLRLTRLDEIPQLLNVLRGEMSFVGPRAEHPLRVEKSKTEIPYYSLRFAVKPGLTGWAQVQSGYGGATGEEAVEKLKFDLFYVKNMSPMLDALIALKTVRSILLARGG